jgi:endo-1,4-beta-xylanase
MRKLFQFAMAMVLVIVAGMMGSVPASAQTSVLDAVFTTSTITVANLGSEAAWATAPKQNISICVNASDTALVTSGCTASGTVQALWNGPVLYLLFSVTDSNVSASASSVQLYIDHYNDKFPKFEEDDGTITITAGGTQTGNNTNAGLMYFPTNWYYHLQSTAAGYILNSGSNKVGYNVEVAWNIGDLPLQNGTTLGMEFVINAASSSGSAQYEVYWNNGFWNENNNTGTNDNTKWGDVRLTGYNGSSAMQLNTFMLQQNIKKATPSATTAPPALVQGIWVNETPVDNALAIAKSILSAAQATPPAATQAQIDSANSTLDTALRGLRRKDAIHPASPYPDPYDLPTLNTLPDPFTFFNGGNYISGTKVQSLADWTKRSAEIKDIAQYYEFGYMPNTPTVTATSTATSAYGGFNFKAITINMQANGNSASFTPYLYLPTTGTPPYPVIVLEDIFSSPYFWTPNAAFLNGYAVLQIPVADYTAYGLPGVASDDGLHTGAFFKLYPYALDNAGDDRGVLLAWAWGTSRGVDALQYLVANDSTYAGLLDLSKLVVTGYSRYGKSALVAGMMDTRFQLTAPGGSGCGGASPYRYDAYGNVPNRSGATLGNIYPWGQTSGGEVMGDHVRHQTHNSNEMIRRFLNDTAPAAVEPRMYQTPSWGYGDRLPFDHHEEIAAIAPRAVLIDATDNDYADSAEGDAIGYEAAMPVYNFLGVPQNLALDLDMGGGGHGLTNNQAIHIVDYANFILYGTPMASDVQAQLTTDPYLNASIYSTYYGGFSTMMPWASTIPHANLLTSLTPSTGTLSPSFAELTTSYSVTVPFGTSGIRITPVTEAANATITVNGQAVVSGHQSQIVSIVPGPNLVNVAVNSVDNTLRTYAVAVTETGATTTTSLATSVLNDNLTAPVTFTATVTATQGSIPPTGSVTFMDGSTTLGTVNLTAATATTSTAAYQTSSLAAGSHSIQAQFTGSNGFLASISNTIAQSVTAPALSAAFSPNEISIASGSSGTSTLTLTPVGGYSGTVTLACGTLPLTNMNCSFLPSSLTFTGTNVIQTSTLTVGTTAHAALQHPVLPGSNSALPVALGFAAFPFVGFMSLFGRGRSNARKLLLLLVFAVVSFTGICAISGCGGSSSNNATPGSYVVPVTVTAGGVTSNLNLIVVVHQ